jgi:hypothetical protein
VGCRFIGCLHISGMAKRAKIAESMANVPLALAVDRVLRVDFVASLAGRRSRPALRFDFADEDRQQWEKEQNDGEIRRTA